MKLLGSTKSANDESVPYLEITEADLIHCDVVINDYQQDPRVSRIFIPNKFFGQL